MRSKIFSKFIPAAGIEAAIRRFPLSYACSLLLFIAYLFQSNDPFGKFIGSTGIPLIIGYFWFGIAALISEGRALSHGKQISLALGGYIILLAITYCGAGIPYKNMGQLILALLLLISAAPFLNRKQDDEAFWIYNRSLWLGVINAIFLGLVLLVGLLSVTASMKYLFGISLGAEAPIVALIAFVYTPGLALLWVPKQQDLKEVHFGPECRILVNWILAPLLTVYTLILYVYAMKIGLSWELPKGNLSNIIIGFGAVGVLTYMVSWPLRDRATTFLNCASHNFFKIMLVPIILLAIAVGVRIGEYGITQDRYMLVLALIWFVLVTGLYIRNRVPPMKWMPLTLAVALLFSSFGPWGFYAVSGYSQISKLNTLLEHNGILVAGHIVPATKEVSEADQKQISAIVEYLVKERQVHRVSEDFKRFADYREKETGPRKQINRKAYERKLEIMDFMGLQFMTQRGDKLEKSLPGVPFSINRRGGDIVGVIGGYDFRLPAIQNITVSMSKQKQWERVFAASVEDGVPEIKLSFDTDGMLKAQIGTQGTLFFNVTEYSKRERGADTGLSSIDAVDGSLKGRILIQSVRGKVDGENLYVEGLSFVLLLDI